MEETEVVTRTPVFVPCKNYRESVNGVNNSCRIACRKVGTWGPRSSWRGIYCTSK